MNATPASSPLIPEGKPKRPRRRKPAPLKDVPTGLDAQLARLSLPEAFTRFGHMAEPNPVGGAPIQFPPEFISGVASLRDRQHCTVRRLHRTVAGNPVLIDAIWKGVLQHGRPANDEQFRLWQELARQRAVPSRATLQRRLTDARRTPSTEVLTTNVPVAVELGYFDPADHSSLFDLGRVTTADGTVYKGPSSLTSALSVDKDTGEIFERRFDAASHVYTDGTGQKVWGPKMSNLRVPRLDDMGHGLTLAFGHVAGHSPSEETDNTADLMEDVLGRLRTMRCDFAPTILVMDGAPDAKHNERFASMGVGLLSPPAAKSKAREGKPRIERQHVIGQFMTANGSVRLELYGTTVRQLTNVNGTLESVDLAQTLRQTASRLADGSLRRYLYLEVTTIAGDTVRIPYRRMKGAKGQPRETRAQFMKRMSLMRVAQRGTPDWDALYGCLRGVAEGGNSHDDACLPNGRIPAYGHHRQLCLIADLRIAEALDLLYMHRLRIGRASPIEVPRRADLAA